MTPETIALLNTHRHPAQRALAFAELYELQRKKAQERAKAQAQGAPRCTEIASLARFRSALPYEPTGAQRRAVAEIAADLARDVPMQRLLLGDVGSGKTVVAFAAAEIVMAAGYQVALLAPTEMLAEQHLRTMTPWAVECGRALAILTGSRPAQLRRAALDAIADGRAQLIVGTHALLTEAVKFARLGLVIVDEQHRFGVEQRGALSAKASSIAPHLLAMSATPIPRTLAMTVYGDLDLSILDELPPGRQRPATKVCTGTRARAQAWATLRREIEQGAQAYVVAPRIDESDEARGIEQLAEEVATALDGVKLATWGPLQPPQIMIAHGQQSPALREEAMAAFRNGRAQVLVATTVIEVGVDVPAATAIVIDGAERFGLAQLHQLRGRVGRGGGRSICLLLTDGASGDAAQRLRTLERCSDGFEIAEADLRLRGPGDVFGGLAQAGMPRLRFADLVVHADLVELAREKAREVSRVLPATLARTGA